MKPKTKYKEAVELIQNGGKHKYHRDTIPYVRLKHYIALNGELYYLHYKTVNKLKENKLID